MNPYHHHQRIQRVMNPPQPVPPVDVIDFCAKLCSGNKDATLKQFVECYDKCVDIRTTIAGQEDDEEEDTAVAPRPVATPAPRPVPRPLRRPLMAPRPTPRPGPTSAPRPPVRTMAAAAGRRPNGFGAPPRATPGTAPWDCSAWCFQQYPASWDFPEWQKCKDVCDKKWGKFTLGPAPTAPRPPSRGSQVARAAMAVRSVR